MTKAYVKYLIVVVLVLAAGCSFTDSSQAADDESSNISNGQSSSGEVRSERLFHIERNKNANIVCYDARLKADGELDSDRPVEVYWLLKAEDGRREDLNWIQRRKAYGFEVEPASSGNGYEMTIVPMPDRKIEVKMVDGKARAETGISGKPAVLEKVYIESSSGLTGPKVHYIKLFGKGREEGKELVEKIVPE